MLPLWWVWVARASLEVVRDPRPRDGMLSPLPAVRRLAGGVVGARLGARPRFSVLQAGLDACLCVQLAWYSPPLTRVRGVISAALEPLAALAARREQPSQTRQPAHFYAFIEVVSAPQRGYELVATSRLARTRTQNGKK